MKSQCQTKTKPWQQPETRKWQWGNSSLGIMMVPAPKSDGTKSDGTKKQWHQKATAPKSNGTKKRQHQKRWHQKAAAPKSDGTKK